MGADKMKSQILDQQTLLELLDSNDLSETQKIQLVEWHAAQLRREEMAKVVKAAVAKVKAKVEQIVNKRAVSQVFSSPLMRAH
jgi:hypothetical protein